VARIEGLESLKAELKAREKEASEGVSVVVGFTQAYALYVHENLEATHKVGQAKFLEQPARTLGKELASIVKQALAKGKSLGMALLLAGLRLQRESQKLVPVDTGALKNSAFTRMEK